MKNILDELVAKGVSGEVIVAVAKLIADAEQTLDRRTKNTERMRAVRARAHTHAHTETQEPPLSLSKEEKIYPKKEERKKVSKKKETLPENWQPIGPQRDLAEADEFRDHARAKGYQYSDWHAAYRNFQRSPYNVRNKPGAPQPAIDEADRAAMLEEFHQAQLRRNANGQGRG